MQTVSVTAPRALAVDSNDNLWMISGTTTVAKYAINANGSLAPPSITLAGLVKPLALAVSPNNASVVVADGGTSQQLKAFDNAGGSLSWTYGQAGGYANDPTVADDKFFFNDLKILYSTDVGLTFIAFQPDGSFWVGDTGNCRMQHFSSNRVLVDRIMNVGYFYSCFTDPNDTKRIFANYLEFERDFSVALGPNNGSWKLAKNWGYGIPPVYDDQFNRLRSVVTLSNGRTYAFLVNSAAIPNPTYVLVELTSTGTRVTNIQIDLNFKIYPDGSLRSIVNSNLGVATEFKTQLLTGFDGNNNPVWGAPTAYATTPALTKMDPVTIDGRQNPGEVSTNNVAVTFCADKENAGRHVGFHLGGVSVGDNKWLWRTSIATFVDYKGPYPDDGSFDIGNSVVYSGSFHQVVGRNIFWGYNGEFWKNTQVNKYNHYYDNGLMLGQFGADGSESDLEAAPEMAGNSKSGTFIKVGNDIYMHHCDESYHGGILEWKISDLNTIAEQTIPVTLTTTAHGVDAKYYDGSNLNNVNLKKSRTNAIIELGNLPSELSNASNFSVRWEGFIEPTTSDNYTLHTNTDEKVRLWIDGDLIIDSWSNAAQTEFSSGAIALTANIRYPIRMEYANTTGTSNASLSWSSPSQSKQSIPSINLFPANASDTSTVVDLMEGLHFNSALQDGMYGWSRNPASENLVNPSNDWWSARTNVQTFKEIWPDIQIELRPGTPAGTSVTRDLGNKTNLNQWSISGKIAWAEIAEWTSNFFEILDNNNKVIARIAHNMSNYPNKAIYANNVIVAEGEMGIIGPQLANLQSISITANYNGVTFQVGAYPPITIAPLDPASNWKNPKTMRVYFESTDGKGHMVDIAEMLFFTNTTNMVLPVNLLSLEAKWIEDDVNLSWKTSDEINIKSYTIERSDDGRNFDILGSEDAKNSAGNHKYNFIDTDALYGTAYYRIKINNTDGTFVNSRIASLKRNTSGKLITYPNPVHSNLNVQYPSETGARSLSILTADGQMIKTFSLTAGSTQTSFGAQFLKPGVYFLEYKNASSKVIARIIKE